VAGALAATRWLLPPLTPPPSTPPLQAAASAWLANLLDAIVCRAVNLDDIDIFADVYSDTTVALAARLCGGLIESKAVKSFCQHPCHSCFADAASAGKHKGVCDFSRLYGVFERMCDRVLADDIIECLRPVFSCKNSISHLKKMAGFTHSTAKLSAYGCSVPRLTRFTGSACMGPGQKIYY